MQTGRLLARALFLDIIGSVFRFPFWWYGEGLVAVFSWAWRRWRFAIRSRAIGLWARHVFVPMYGSFDWPGRLISFFVRVTILFWRATALLAEGLYYFMCCLVWVLWPMTLFVAF
jgi:hypothetical protein